MPVYNQTAGIESLIKEANTMSVWLHPLGADHKPRAFSAGDAGLQTQFLVAAVPARGSSNGGPTYLGADVLHPRSPNIADRFTVRTRERPRLVLGINGQKELWQS